MNIFLKSLKYTIGFVLITVVGLVADLSSLLGIDFREKFIDQYWPVSLIAIIELILIEVLIGYLVIVLINNKTKEIKTADLESEKHTVLTEIQVEAESEIVPTINKFELERRLDITNEFEIMISSLSRLLIKTCKYNQGRVVNGHEIEYKRLKSNYIDSIDHIEKPLSEYIEEINEYSVNKTPLSDLFSYHSLQSLYDSYIKSEEYWGRSASSSEIENKINESIDKVYSTLKRYQNQLRRLLQEG